MSNILKSAPAGSTIILGIKFFQNGNLFTPFSIASVNIFSVASGGSVLYTINPIFISTGFYKASFDIPDTLASGTYFSEWSWVAENSMVSKVQRYPFEVTAVAEISTAIETEPLSVSVACRARPEWVQRIGLRLVEDIGNGISIRLSWQEAIPTDINKQVHYNIYKATNRVEVLDNWPIAITTATEAIINIPPGDMHFFIVRATEFKPSEFDISKLTQIGFNLGEYPTATTLLEDIDAYGATIKVTNNGNFPDAGFLLIDTEVIKYSSVGANEFFVEDTQRGAFQTRIAAHIAGAEVKLWHGVEDGNSIIIGNTAAWTEDNGVPRNLEALGQFNVDEDGYRSNKDDILTTDLRENDKETKDFSSYDFSGYHRPSIQDTFDNQCVGSYLGGEFNGQRGFNFIDRNLSQLDSMLQVTGEAVVFLRRKQTGRRCKCVTLRRENPRFRCDKCFNTPFEGGFDRFFNKRAISERFVNTEGKILIRVSPFTDDVKLTQGQGLVQITEISAWSIDWPALKNRDILIRFNLDTMEEYRYEILNVTRNKLIFGEYGKQEIKMRRLDKTDVIQQYTINDSSLYVFE